MGAGEEDQDRQNTESESSNVIEVAVFFALKVASDWPSVDRFGNNFGGLMTLGLAKSVPNFC